MDTPNLLNKLIRQKLLNSSLTKINKHLQLRLRVFAGPNGSGKSTVIDRVKKLKPGGRPIDFGFYINADDIAALLRGNGLSFAPFQVKATNKDFYSIALASGLINEEFPEARFKACYILRKNTIKLRLLAKMKEWRR